MCQLIYKLPLHLVHNEICITFSALLGLGQYFHLLLVDTESAQWQTSSCHLATLKDIISFSLLYIVTLSFILLGLLSIFLVPTKLEW